MNERIGAIAFELHVIPKGKQVNAMDHMSKGANGFGSTGEM